MKIRARVVGQVDIPRDKLLVFNHARLQGEDFSRRDLMQFGSVGSRFEDCRFEDTRVLDAQFGSGREMSEYVECNFDGLRFNHAGGHARFVRCSFRDVYLRNWTARSTELIDCVFSGRMHTVIFCGRIPVAEERAFLGRELNEFHGNDFSGVKMVDVNFTKGIDLTQQRLPSGPKYIYVADAAAAVGRLQAGLENWQATPEVRRTAQIIADGCKKMTAGGQRQLFVDQDGYYQYPEKTFPREALDKVFSLLRGEKQ